MNENRRQMWEKKLFPLIKKQNYYEKKIEELNIKTVALLARARPEFDPIELLVTTTKKVKKELGKG